MAEVASAFVSLIPSARGFGRATESQLGGEVSRAGKFLGIGFGKAFAGVAAIGAAVGFTKTLTDSIGAFKDLALETLKFQRITGGTVKSASRLQFAIHDSGVDVEQATKSITIFSKKLGTAAPDVKKTAALTQLMGVRFLNAAGNIKPMGKLLPKLADRFAKMPNGVRKTALATQLFGRGGVQMLPFLNQGSKAIAEMADKSDQLGLTMTKRGLESFKKYREASRTLGDTFEGLKVSIGARLLPVITRFMTALTRTVTPAIQAFMGWLAHSEGVKTFIHSIKQAMRTVATIVGGLITTVAPFAGKLAGLLDKKVLPAVGRVLGKVRIVADRVKAFFTTGAGATALQTALDVVKASAATIKTNFDKAAAAVGTMTDKAAGFKLGDLDSKKIGEAIGTALVKGLEFLGKSAGKITKTFGTLFSKVDWVGIGIAIGRQVPALLIGLAAGILNFDFGGLLRGIGAHWFDILMGIIIIAFAPSKFVGPLERILTRIPFVGRFLAVAVRWLNDLGGKLVKFGSDLFRSFAEGFGRVRFPGAGIVSKVLGAFKMLPARLLNFWVTLQVRMGVWALDAFAAAGRGARAGIGALFRLVGTIGRRVLAGLGDLGKLLFDAGRTLIDGLIRGITSKLKDVGKAMGKVAGKIKGFLPGSPVKEGPLTSWNKGGAGKRLVGTIVTGIDAKRPEAGDAMMRLTRGLNTFAVSPRVDASISGHAGAVSGGPQFNVESVYAQDVNDFLSQMQVRSRQAALGGLPR